MDLASTFVSASAEGDVIKVSKLLASEPDLVNCESDGRTPLLAAVHHGRQEMLELLLSQPGVNLDQGVGGWSPLHEACFVNNVEAVQQLVLGGADINIVDGDGYTPVMVALWFQRLEALREMLATPGVSLTMPEAEGSIEELAGSNEKLLFMVKRALKKKHQQQQ